MLTDEQIGKVMRRAYEKNLGDSALKMLLSIAMNTNDRGFCVVSNEKFAIRLRTSPRSITGWITSLKEQKFINIIQNKHRHERWIYINGLNFTKYKTPEFEDMSPEQKMFHEAFPNRDIDCEVPDNVEIKRLIDQIKRSRFLKNAHNMSLKSCCIKYYKQIMAGWKDVEDMPSKSNFSTQREYTKEEVNALLQNIDDILI